MTLEEKYRALQQQKYQEDINRQSQLATAQSTAKQLETLISKIREKYNICKTEEIRKIYADILDFYDSDKLMDKAYADALYKKCKQLEKEVSAYADRLMGV